MRNLNLFVCSIVLKISNAMGNKHCLPFFSEEWAVAKTTVEPQNTHLFFTMLIKLQQNKPILHPGWQSSQNKPCVLWQKSVFLLSPVYFRRIYYSQPEKNYLLLHMRWDLTAIGDGMMFLTLQLSRCMFGASTVQMCSCVSLDVEKTDNILFNTI